VPVDDPSRYGVVVTDDGGRVEAFVEKPPPGEAPSNWINAGTYVCEPSVLDRIPDDRPVSVERETFPAMVGDGGLYGFQSDTYWVDAGTPATYLSVQLDLIRGVRGEPVDGVNAAARVDDGALIDDAVVGRGARVAGGASVRESVVMDASEVAEGAVVERSIVGRDARIGARAHLSDLTVVGAAAKVEPGAVLAGARVPEPAP